jgi:hypothetical protein
MPNPNNVTIGCPDEYSAIITGRDLTSYAARLDWSNLTWSRVLDEISSASVTVPDAFGGLRCNIEMNDVLVPWRFGLRIERNSELVWAGPITSVERPERGGVGADYVTISADDKMAWLSKRTARNVLSFQQADAADVFRTVIGDAVSFDNAFDLRCPSFTSGHSMTRDILPLDFEYTDQIIAELADSAVDYFVFGTDLVVYDARNPGWWTQRGERKTRIARTPDPYGRYLFGLFTDEAFAGRPGFTLDGYAQGNNVIVPGADSGEAGFRRYWTASDVDLTDGLLTYVDVSTLYRPQETGPIFDDGVFQNRADSLLAWKRTTPATVSGGWLSESAPVTVQSLLPGSLWAIDLAEKGVERLLTVQRLKRVDVSVDANDGSLVERIAPSLIPVGSDETNIASAIEVLSGGG